MSRAWYLIGGILLAVALAGVGYYTGYSHTLDRWKLEHAALADSIDSARVRANRMGESLDDAQAVLDSALAAWRQDSLRQAATIRSLAQAVADPAPHGTSTPPSPAPPAVPLTPPTDTGALGNSYATCSAVVKAATAYRSACQAARDSLGALIAAMAARPVDTVVVRGGLHKWAVVLGPFAGVTFQGKAAAGVAINAGFVLW